MRLLTLADVEIELRAEPEDIPFVGNCSAIDEETDRQTEEWIEQELNNGNQWAWCFVVVTVRWEGFEGRATLGGCSYESENAFRQPGGYFEDLQAEALDELNKVVAQAAAAIHTLE